MTDDGKYHTFLSHPRVYGEWVESLAVRLTDEHDLRVWLDRWVLVPGRSWQQEMAKGLDEAGSCAVFIGAQASRGWFQQEIEKALNRQAGDPTFRVLPVLLPDAPVDLDEVMPAFLGLRTWVDFRAGSDPNYALHVLTQGIRGEAVGRWPLAPDGNTPPGAESLFARTERKLNELQRLDAAAGGLSESVRVDFQRRIISEWFEGGA